MKGFREYIETLHKNGKHANQFKELLDALEHQKIPFTRDEFLEHVASFKEIEFHHTPNEVANLIVSFVRNKAYTSAIDICCGTGNILYFLQNYLDELIGVEINENIAAVTKYFMPDIKVVTADTLSHPIDDRFDLVVGSIPWGQRVEVDGQRMFIEEAMIRESFRLVNEAGEIILVVPYTVLVSRQYDELRREIKNSTHRIIGLPGGLFRNSSLKIALLFLKPDSESEDIEFGLVESLKEGGLEQVDMKLVNWSKADLIDRWDPDHYLKRDSDFYSELEAQNTVGLSALASLISGVVVPKEELNEQAGLLCLRPTHISNDGLDLTRNMQFLDEESLSSSQSRAVIKPGDVVISRVLNEMKMVIYRSDYPPAIASNLLIIIRANDNDYIKSYLSSDQGREVFAKQAGDLNRGQIMPSISLKDLGSIQIPVLPLDELNRLGDEHIAQSSEEELVDLLHQLQEVRAQRDQTRRERDQLRMAREWFEDRFSKVQAQMEQVHQKLDTIIGLLESLNSDFETIKSLPRQDEEKLVRLYQSLDNKIERLANEDSFSIDMYIEEIKRWLDTWELLDERSKKFLPIAEFLFDELSKLKDPDYSPFVVQYCRCIENELLIKLFQSYHDHIQALPEFAVDPQEFEMNNVKLFASMVVKDRRDYTLGNMTFILGLMKEGGKTLKKSKLLQHFKGFAVSYFEARLFEKAFLEELGHITSDYRNKAAHPSIMSVETALKCQELVRHSLIEFLGVIKSKSD